MKRWCLLFRCAVTSAFHTEMLYSMDTDSFLSAFARFTAIRPTPALILCDNGSQLCSGDRQFARMTHAAPSALAQQSYTWKGLDTSSEARAFVAHQQ